ncbi:MAG: hypothetical protein EA405_06125 [Rhodospirillales bacterium]|nr:MAG: hypothetical protein EA405_06125 [Rhodospirillales bacterium]
MRKPLVLSAALHALVIALLILGVPSFGKRDNALALPDALVVDVLTVDDVTNVPPRAPQSAPKPAPKPAPEAKPEAAPDPAPRPARLQPPPAPEPLPAPAPVTAEAPPTAVPAPEMLAVRPAAKPASPRQPEPEPEPNAEAETSPTPPAPDPPPSRTVAEPAEPEPAQEADPAPDFQSVLRAVAGLQRPEPSPAMPEPDRAGDEPRSFDALISEALNGEAVSHTPGRSFDPDRPMTISEIDEVRRQIERCWNVPAGAREARDLVVTVRVEMAPDGRPRMAEIVEDRRLGNDGYYRAAAESALRAVLNDRCHPFRLPPDKYERWKTMTLIFNPKDMVGS